MRSKHLTQNSAQLADFSASINGPCLTNAVRKPNIKIYLLDFPNSADLLGKFNPLYVHLHASRH
jgi:hypothetical protein